MSRHCRSSCKSMHNLQALPKYEHSCNNFEQSQKLTEIRPEWRLAFATLVMPCRTIQLSMTIQETIQLMLNAKNTDSVKLKKKQKRVHRRQSTYVVCTNTGDESRNVLLLIGVVLLTPDGAVHALVSEQ